MTLTIYSDALAFINAVGDELEEHEVENGLMLSVVTQLVEKTPVWMKGSPYLAAFQRPEGLSTAGMITPPFGLVLAQGDRQPQPGGEAIAEDLFQRSWPLADVNGPKQHARLFAETWSNLTGGSYKLYMAERIYRLSQVERPAGVAGEARWALAADLSTLVDWMIQFNLEALDELVLEEDVTVLIQGMLEEKQVLLWQVDSQPVSMAVRIRETQCGAVISYVYTPKEQRRRGYAGALVAELSQRCLDSGKSFCTLFTDLANPTSNSIYQQIGYRPVCDFDKYSFSSLTTG